LGFFRDIAGGGGRISLYRVQFFVTTVLLGSWFIYTVWQAKAMPNVPFSASVLFGLSSAMYLLSKWQLLGASFTRNSTDTGSKKLTADRAILRKLIAVVSVRDWFLVAVYSLLLLSAC
jgi:hypothetical protein